MGTETVSGIARERVDPWLAEHVAGARPPFEYELIAGGRSNLTYLVQDGAGRRLVLRRPPLGQVLQSAHDMGREHRIIAALGPTAVPVPEALAFCDDEAVNDAPFYVMAFVSGVVLDDERDAERELDVPARAAAGRSLVDVLADLHAVDPDAVGLGDLGRKEGYVERQLRRWQSQFEKSRTRDIPAMQEVHQQLAAHIPQQRRTGIVHGDYRLGNCLVGDDGAVRAVLDWELCTLGDPLADVGWLVAWWVEPGQSAAHLRRSVPSMAPGFESHRVLVERYVERSGADAADLEYYVALAYWKLACITEGVHARYRAGVMGAATSAEIEAFGEQVRLLADAALERTERLA
ncbi:MAG TPA: phosphotransferase family protein [Conexibacter sp.]|nr:phosphotransferase family protein [Conexibacter sp.]